MFYCTARLVTSQWTLGLSPLLAARTSAEHRWTHVGLGTFSVLPGTPKAWSAGPPGNSVFNPMEKATWCGPDPRRKESKGDPVAGLKSRRNCLSLFLLLSSDPCCSQAESHLPPHTRPPGRGLQICSPGGCRSGHTKPTGQRQPAEDTHSRGCTGEAWKVPVGPRGTVLGQGQTQNFQAGVAP